MAIRLFGKRLTSAETKRAQKAQTARRKAKPKAVPRATARPAARPAPSQSNAFKKFMRQQKALLTKQQASAKKKRLADTARAKKERSAILAAQRKRETGFLGRFRGAISGQEGLQAMSDRLAQELGLPGARTAQTQLNQEVLRQQGFLAGLPEQLEEQTSGFRTQAQLEALQQAKADPLQRRLQDLARTGAITGEQLAQLESELGTKLGFGVAEQEKELLPFNIEAEFLSDQGAREITLYTNERQNQLDLLINEINTGAQLTSQQAQFLQQLALQEDQFIKEKELIKARKGSTPAPFDPSQWFNLGGGTPTPTGGGGNLDPDNILGGDGGGSGTPGGFLWDPFNPSGT